MDWKWNFVRKSRATGNSCKTISLILLGYDVVFIIIHNLFGGFSNQRSAEYYCMSLVSV